jgi:SAM-dependent methyltransferase
MIGPLFRLLSRHSGGRSDPLVAAAARRFRRSRYRVRFGTIRRNRPVSDHWGRDRGTPLDRMYIEAFLAVHASDIRGNVLEVRDPTYTRRYGTSVVASEVLDVDPGNANATIIADMADMATVSDDRFDCFILTQTLQYVFDVRSAIAEASRVLRPGGVLLCTVPSITGIDTKAPSDLWRFTPDSCRLLFEPIFGADRLDVEGHGNLLVASAFLVGASAEDLSMQERNVRDQRYPIVVTVRAVKSELSGTTR